MNTLVVVCDRSLLVHLELFAKMRNPKSLYEEARLRSIFEQVTLQRSAHLSLRVDRLCCKGVHT